MKTLANALVKFAQDLDKNGKYSEADKIDEMIKSLCDRTGLKIADDMIAMADEFDNQGMYEEANQIDDIVKTAKCPQCGNPDFALTMRSDICEDCGYPMVKITREPGVKKMLDVDKHTWQQKRMDDDYQEKLNSGELQEWSNEGLESPEDIFEDKKDEK